MGVVGGYLVYLAYQLVRDMINGVPSTMPKALTILFAVLFTGAGGTLVVYAWILWKRGREAKEEDTVEIPEDENSTKEEHDNPEK